MKKKLLVTASVFGHIVSFHLPYLQSFREQGWEVHVACGGEEKAIACADRLIPLPFKKNMLSPANLRATLMLGRLIEQEHYELIIMHTSLAAFFTRLALIGMRNRPRTINVVHGYLFDSETQRLKRHILETAELICAELTDKLLVMNKFDLEWARTHKSAKSLTFINGMGLDTKMPHGSAKRSDYGLAEDELVLIYPAEFSKRKNQAMLIRAMAKLPERVKLMLPGEGALLETCRDLSASLGLSDRVIFPGFLTDIPSVLEISDIAVSSSRSEGLPFNLLEAMNAGLPIVCTAVKGNTELVRDGETGILFSFGDEAGFVEAVKRLYEDESLRRSLGQNGRRLSQSYSLEAVMPLVMKEYLE